LPPEALITVAVMAQILLTLGLYVWLGIKRLPRLADGTVHIRDIALDKDNWPDSSKQAHQALQNQFELPVLFYAAAALNVVLWPGLITVIIAVAFVISRYVHAFIFITSNHVVRRFYAFVTGLALIGLWWLILAFQLALRIWSGV
jgi:hypothetical protein